MVQAKRAPYRKYALAGGIFGLASVTILTLPIGENTVVLNLIGGLVSVPQLMAYWLSFGDALTFISSVAYWVLLSLLAAKLSTLPSAKRSLVGFAVCLIAVHLIALLRIHKELQPLEHIFK